MTIKLYHIRTIINRLLLENYHRFHFFSVPIFGAHVGMHCWQNEVSIVFSAMESMSTTQIEVVHMNLPEEELFEKLFLQCGREMWLEMAEQGHG